jgi:4-amino-4-deoxy-L-arabinose transferase-like glycosyltransferase
MHGVAIRFWNYALFCAAIAGAVLILADLAQPSNYGAEGDRVLWTLCGVGIAVMVMLLAGLLAKRRGEGARQPAPQPA